MLKALYSRDDIDRLYAAKKKKEEDDSPALRIALMHQYKDFKTTLKRTKKDYLHQQITALAT